MSSSELRIAKGKKTGKLLMFRDPYIVRVLSCLLIVFHIRLHKQQQCRITKQYNIVSSYNPSIDGIVIRQIDAIASLNKPRSLISLIRIAAPLIRFLVLHIHTSLSYTSGEIVHVTKFSDMSTVHFLTDSTAIFVQRLGD